jgi:hypothetical protein
MARRDSETVRLPGGETVPRRLDHQGDTNLRSDDRPPVTIDGWETLDDTGNVTELSITLRTQPGEPGLTMEELGDVNLAALHHNRVLAHIYNRRAAIRIPEDTDTLAVTGRTFDQLARERQAQARTAMRTTSKRIRTAQAVPPERLAEILDTFENGGINAVMKLGYSRSHGYKLVARAREEVSS